VKQTQIAVLVADQWTLLKLHSSTEVVIRKMKI